MTLYYTSFSLSFSSLDPYLSLYIHNAVVSLEFALLHGIVLLQYAVGRGKENAIKCLSLYVSRKHCKFVQRGENLVVVDLSVSISFVLYY
jgi:hypothetical protein